jgi:hypothetical protein
LKKAIKSGYDNTKTTFIAIVTAFKNFITFKSSFHFSLFSKADRGKMNEKMKDFGL